ncbi:NAD(P)-dependent oxidoreductase [Mycoplasma crocodyli]|uniref:D-lactate dehydrogenase n=1 Tax=Mycoplasma crocodyli (strain ATCC 51981 / MP145) TaxID=512564 RepID=D5E610_MYCCM|nr:NAD(P)-dependent oxidoreductase [Mycoplasma crocodyli]ADE19955.1 D-lactate dehydrogenase [Mycoplasma crocodyli MP145]
MKIAFFDAKEYDIKYFDKVNNGRHEITYFKENLGINTIKLAKGFDAVCGFVNTFGDKFILELLAKEGIKVWLQRSMGYNKVDLAKAAELGISVFRIPNYSAESVAEFAMGSMLALNRKIVIANRRVKKYNFSLNDLDGLCVHGSTVGVIGGGKIGQSFVKIAKGMGARVLVFDSFNETNFPNLAKELGFEYAPLTKVLKESDFISLHAPLLPSTRYVIDEDAIKLMKHGVIIINTARGELMNITAVIDGLKKGIIGGLASDVLEREEGRFYEDISNRAEEYQELDPEWYELIKMKNVLITSHQAFLTNVALTQIASITLNNADDAQKGDFSKALLMQPDGKIKNG